MINLKIRVKISLGFNKLIKYWLKFQFNKIGYIFNYYKLIVKNER